MSGPIRYWTHERILDAIRAYTDKHGRQPGWNDFVTARPETPPTRIVVDRFGTWNAALEAAGLTPKPAHRSISWTETMIVEALQRWNAEHGEPPRLEEWRVARLDTPSASTVVLRFGSWNKALEAAGFAPRPRCRKTKWTRDTVATAMLDHLCATGRWPSFKEWKAAGHGVRPNTGTVLNLFGSWSAAKLHAGWDPGAQKRTVRVRGCVGCGGELDGYTIGCKTCNDRRRRRRELSKNGRGASVETTSLSTPGVGLAGPRPGREPLAA